MKTKKLHSLKYAFLTSLVLVGMHAHASVVRDDVDYQLFRDFAENKGKFQIGVNNIDIYNTHGQKLGVVLQGVPMPDFSSVNSKIGTHTLIDPQYIVSVAHNKPSDHESGFGFHLYNQEFGGQTFNPDNHRYNYAIVDTNAHESYTTYSHATIPFDYKTP